MSELEKIARFGRIATNGIHLHVAEAGPEGGPLVFLLHGFPEFWYGWRNQIAPLADKGFHVVAPDQRGYNLSDKPKGIPSYDLDRLAEDILGLADRFGTDQFTVVGHDWGAAVAWWLAAHHGRRVSRCIVLNAPFPAVWLEAIKSHPEQKRKSAYVGLLAKPLLPELLIGLSRRRTLEKAFGNCTRPEAFTRDDIDRYVSALSQPGALTATLNYYRAILKKRFEPAAHYRIDVPVLVIWGDRDPYAVPELADASSRLCRDATVVHVPGATHWIQHEQPEMVCEQIARFAKSG